MTLDLIAFITSTTPFVVHGPIYASPSSYFCDYTHLRYFSRNNRVNPIPLFGPSRYMPYDFLSLWRTVLFVFLTTNLRTSDSFTCNTRIMQYILHCNSVTASLAETGRGGAGE